MLDSWTVSYRYYRFDVTGCSLDSTKYVISEILSVNKTVSVFFFWQQVKRIPQTLVVLPMLTPLGQRKSSSSSAVIQPRESVLMTSIKTPVVLIVLPHSRHHQQIHLKTRRFFSVGP